jgi:hypothetical protein
MPTRCWMAPEMPIAMYIFGSDGLAGTAHLAFHGKPAGVADGPRGRQFGAQRVAKLSQPARMLPASLMPRPTETIIRRRPGPPRAAIRGTAPAAGCESARANRRRQDLDRGGSCGNTVGAVGARLQRSEVRGVPRQADVRIHLALKSCRTSTSCPLSTRCATTSLTATRPSRVASLGRKSRTW